MAFDWNEAAIEKARRMYAIEGMSARDTAAALGDGCTRNAVIGKAHRLGWGKDYRQQPTSTGRVREVRPPHPKPSRAPKAVRRPRKAVIPSMGAAPVVVGIDYKLTAATAEQRAACRKSGLDVVAVVEAGAGVESPNARPFLEATGCKWPLAGGMVCCNRVVRGVYCAGHASVAFVGKAPPSQTAPQTSHAARQLTRFDGVVDLTIPAPPKPAPTAWDSGRAAA